ncbi:glycosyl hydrolase family 28-related protein [Candidatus Latescibacterota bacterium]
MRILFKVINLMNPKIITAVTFAVMLIFARTPLHGQMFPNTQGTVNARDHGALGNGMTDDTAAIQKALDTALTDGPVCFLPPGKYRVEGSLVVPPGVTLQGASGGVPHSMAPAGTVLLAYGGKGDADGEPLVTLKHNSVIRNMIIHYPEQTLPDVIPYPWSIRGDGQLCQVTDMTLTNPYQALDFGTKHHELHTIRNVFACPLKIGVFIDQCTDIGRIENVHFNPNFWTRMELEPKYPGGNIRKYLENNLIGFKIGKTDWEFISNSFVIFPKIGFLFDDFGHGPGNVVITQSGSDIGPVAVQVNRVQPHAGIQFANCQFMATIVIGKENIGPVKLANCGFWGVPEITREHIIKHGLSTLLLTSCHFTGWDFEVEGFPCIRADGGRLVVNGCEFMDRGKQQVVLEKGLTAATIFGNLLRRKSGIVDKSGADVQIGLNSTATKDSDQKNYLLTE